MDIDAKTFRLKVEASDEVRDRPVWVYLEAGMFTGGTFLTVEQAREIARAFDAAADFAQEAACAKAA